jgi:hypothetical protein
VRNEVVGAFGGMKNLVGIFLVDVILEGFRTAFLKVLGSNLDEVGEGALDAVRVYAGERV